MDLALLRTFLAVYRAGSLTRAVPLLGLSQPTITAQLKTLESALDKKLFERLPRGVAPTPVAEELARRVAPHIDALTAIGDRGVDAHDPFSTPVHLAGPGELITTRVLPSLADLVGAGLRLRVSLGLSDDLLSGLAAGTYDLVISTIRPRARAITATPLTDEEFVLVAAPGWAERIDADLLSTDPLAALRNVPLVSYAEDLPVIRRYWRTSFGVRPKGSAVVVVPDLRGVLAATVSGCGITVLPRYLCVGELAEGRLVPLLEPEIPPINTLYLAARTGTVDRPHISAVHSTLLSMARLW
ncbi:LysR family transcriptional regulator [Stackebrandtia nassauensis]|uniref:Transcriptional regulator, LysR family n=1 Tax=Stackebrandtia nassauensis (strain DSM 44728 / CIP 108903 / NRRL B-16338 / NBRC 102104 / LLR-40K-21) TaxID=446470 RepID=D3PWC4_STANL|nr:LysR family transcriptional regulator [Stackebrandtia nassauensis]ADD41281.1 transcriptional regulator, LysR family [Stackebrandtia nassauensis DSM 44728]